MITTPSSLIQTMKLTTAVKVSPFIKQPQYLLKSRKSEQLFTLHYLDGVKFASKQATKVQRGEGQRNSSTVSLTSTLDWGKCQRYAPAALPPGKNRYSLCRRLGVLQGADRCGKSRPHRDSISGPSSP
jgi:hypothetical protein